MIGDGADGNTGPRMKARWLAMGLSQSDLAEVLDNAVAQTQGGAASSEIHDNHLTRIAETLVVPLGYSSRPTTTEAEDEVVASNKAAATLETLLGLRLMRAFNQMKDSKAKRMLVHLAEQIVKRQANRRNGG
jgi:transcriptional regulator with XRE-family HTH domain